MRPRLLSAARCRRPTATSSSPCCPPRRTFRNVYFGDARACSPELSSRRHRSLIASTIDPHTAREVAATASDVTRQSHGGCPGIGRHRGRASRNAHVHGRRRARIVRAHRAVALCRWARTSFIAAASGTGQAAKICNNLLLGISMIGVAEAMNLGVQRSVSNPKTLAGIINTSSGRCWSSDTYNPYPGVMQNVPAVARLHGRLRRGPHVEGLEGWPPMLPSSGQTTGGHGRGAAQQLYQLLSAQGGGALDFSAIIDFVEAPDLEGGGVS